MQLDGFDITAPAVFDEPLSETAVLGASVWLWMHSPTHRQAPLEVLSTLLLPAIKSRQFMLAAMAGQPVFYAAWAHFDAAAEARYISQPPHRMPQQDWHCGERMWMLDWVAPFGHTRAMRRLLHTRMFPRGCMRALHHRGNERGLRIGTFHGAAITREEARYWFATHPLLTFSQPPLS